MRHQLHPGDQVEVHTSFRNSWVTGFEIAELIAEGYRVRRNSDGSLLPGHTSESDVRRPPEGAGIAFGTRSFW